jgi:RNA polymerase subunit RPABC4/transcription elongation factor Spt4
MDFRQATEKFKLLKLAWVNGAISREDLQNAVDTELSITDKNNNIWKIDEDSDNWLIYDEANQSWVERQPPGISHPAYDEPHEIKIKIEPPAAPEVPDEIYRDWKSKISQESSPTDQAEKPETTVENFKSCQNCGKANKADAKFCTNCGETITSVNFCTQCGRKLKPENQFCPGCGKQL